jgi:hypothetical protein
LGVKPTKEYIVMALADPLEITLNAVAIPLPRTDSGNRSGTYESEDGAVAVVFSHQKGKRNRSVARVTHKKIVPDLFLGDLSTEVSMSMSLVFDTPTAGYDPADQAGIFSAFMELISDNSAVILAQFLGGES